MKILHLNYSDNTGGAAKAALRIHECLLKEGHESKMWVCKSDLTDPLIYSPQGYLFKLYDKIRSKLSNFICRRKIKKTGIYHSLSIFPSFWPKLINSSDYDIVNLHWVNGEMLSVKDISKIKKPIVWTLHDMWAFSGAEHLSYKERWIRGYSNNRNGIFFWDLNRFVWKQKKRHWKKSMHIVSPSSWMSDCVGKSPLMKNWPRKIIPNCLDTKFWKAFDKSYARKMLQLPLDKPLLCFGTFNENNAFHKGADLLNAALEKLENKIPELEIVTFGNVNKNDILFEKFPTYNLGFIQDELLMKAVYSASDAIAVPSRNESFGQVASEAMACSRPVVCFDSSGLRDIVDHKVNGYLAKSFDASDFAMGILWLMDNEKSKLLSEAARNKVQRLFSENTVAQQYLDFYRDAIEVSQSE